MKFHHELGHPESIAQTIATNKGYWICTQCEYIYSPDSFRYTHLLVVDETLTQGEYDRLKKDTCIICKMKNTRKDLGLNTAQIGEICGVSKRTVEDWEQNRFFPSKPAMMLLTAWLEKQER